MFQAQIVYSLTSFPEAGDGTLQICYGGEATNTSVRSPARGDGQRNDAARSTPDELRRSCLRVGGAAWDYFRVWGPRIKIVRDSPADHRAGRRGPRDGLLRFIPLHLRSYLSHRPALLESETILLTDDDAKAVCRPGQARCLILPSALRDPIAWGQ
jgi:hypothetical protein